MFCLAETRWCRWGREVQADPEQEEEESEEPGLELAKHSWVTLEENPQHYAGPLLFGGEQHPAGGPPVGGFEVNRDSLGPVISGVGFWQ